MRLSKIVPAKLKTIEALWCVDFTEMNQQFRRIRENHKDKLDSCYWCDYKFKDGDTISLAAIVGKGNKVFCGKCAYELQNSDNRYTGKPPDVLYREDGEKFSRNEDGTYSMDTTWMHNPYTWSFKHLQSTKAFYLDKEKTKPI